MRIESSEPILEQLEIRLHQCSFLRSNYPLVGITLSTARMQLLDSFGERLGNHYDSLLANRTNTSESCLFTLVNFDIFIKDFFESFGKEFTLPELEIK